MREKILQQAISLFAAHGYRGVSMRNLSQTVGIKASSLYYHFPDKQTLYLEAIDSVYSDKVEALMTSIKADGTPLERLEQFISHFVELMGNDPNFRSLLHRELLDGDKIRLKLLADKVFTKPFLAMTELVEELDPEGDPYLMAISIAGLVLFYFETAGHLLKFKRKVKWHTFI